MAINTETRPTEEAHVHSSGHVYIHERTVSNAIRKGDMSTLLINHSHAQTTQIGNKKFNFLFSMVRSILGGKRGGGLHCCHQSNKHSIFISSPVVAIQITESITNKLWKLNL